MDVILHCGVKYFLGTYVTVDKYSPYKCSRIEVLN